MLLKSLEIQGFKSFPDRTRIVFNPGVTVIVGPNGSGKSNISDAIRWVLGEQSTKALRGGRMEDVIFSGAGTRRAMAAAEVSLTIDNASGFLKSEYNEVTVTRKFYRSGESEFFINRKSARLKDIHELFMDTGLGRDGYSMISQGKIDEILSVKSEQRREIFDEATGISKYRYRREEAEKRLADADANLTRINELIEDMAARIEPLRIEAEREEKYLGLQDKSKALDISLVMLALSGIGERLEQAKKTVQAFSDDLEHSRAESEKLDAQAEALIRETAENQRTLEALRDELRALEHEAAQIGEDIAVKRTQSEHIAQDIERMQRESEESSAGGADAQSQLAAHRQTLADREAMAALTRDQIESLTAQTAETAGRRLAKREELDRWTARMQARSAGNLETSGKIETSKQVKAELSVQLEALTEDERLREQRLAQALETQTQLHAACEAAQAQTESLNNILSGYRLKLDSRRRRMEAGQNKLAEEKQEAAGLENRLSMLRELARDYEGFNRAVRTVMREHENGGLRGIHGPISALMKLPEEYIPAAETALGQAMQNIVVSEETDAQRAIGLLKSRDAGRATFLPLSTIRPNLLSEKNVDRERGYIGILSELITCKDIYRPIFQNLLGRTVLCDNLDNAVVIARNFRHRFRLVTLDGQVVNAGGSMTGGSLNRSTGILSRANEIEKLEKTLPGLQEKLREHGAVMENLTRETQALSYQVEQAQEELRTAQEEAVRAAAALEAHEAIVQNLSSGGEEREAREKALKERISALEGELSALGEALAQGEEALKKLEAEAQDIQAQEKQLEEQEKQTEEKLLEARMRLSALDAQKHAEEASIAALEQTRAQEKQRAERRESELAQAQKAYGESLADVDALTEAREKILASCTERSEKIKAEVDVQHEFERRRIETERLAQEENRRMLDLERRMIRAQADLEAVENEEETLDGRLWDNYELSRSQAAALAEPVENRAEAERELERIKRQIRSLGTIYPGSMREYQALCQRYEFMDGQKKDAELSRNEILEIIRDINVRMKEIFTEQFAIIAESFSRVFAQIFGGGTAKLALSDPADILGSGVDIMVQPPGKQLKVLTLLSGGERALSAIALYFAIMSVRPAPFCVLDEIESALDEANVRLFARYLREMSDKIQFIAISHRRGTMEAADMLYGVAMPQQGISRILALNVAEAEKEYIKD